MGNTTKYKNEYVKKTYARIPINIPKEKKAVLEELAMKYDKSINRIFIDAVEHVYGVDLTLVESKLKQPEQGCFFNA